MQTEGQAAGASGASSRAAHPTFKGIVFDLETSGLSKSKNRIVEIAALELESGDSMQTLVNIHPEQAGALSCLSAIRRLSGTLVTGLHNFCMLCLCL